MDIRFRSNKTPWPMQWRWIQMFQHSRTKLAFTIGIAAWCCCMVSGCSLLAIGAVAIGESRRQNSPEVVAARQADARKKLAQMQSIKKRADLGDAYAAIEVAKKCFEASYPCMVPEPEEVFRNYSERGYEIATYYHASIQLGMDVWGVRIYECKRTIWGRCKFLNVEAGAQAMAQLARRGCEYEVQAFERLEWIYPCDRLKRSRQ